MIDNSERRMCDYIASAKEIRGEGEGGNRYNVHLMITIWYPTVDKTALSINDCQLE